RGGQVGEEGLGRRKRRRPGPQRRLEAIWRVLTHDESPLFCTYESMLDFYVQIVNYLSHPAAHCTRHAYLRLGSGPRPALGGLLVAAASFHPARAVRRVFLLPERRAGLQVVHDE